MNVANLLRRLDERVHKRGLRVCWICDLVDIAYGMDATSPSFPGYPRPRNPFFLATNWWFNGLGWTRRPIRNWRHAHGEHWTATYTRTTNVSTTMGYRRVLKGWGVKLHHRYEESAYCYLCDWSAD